MFEVLVQMAGLIFCGSIWRKLEPAGLAAEPTRKVLTAVVYYLMLPVLVLSVMWRAELGSTTLLIALTGIAAVVIGMLLSVLFCRLCNAEPRVAGAIVLAASFPNVTYLGLPVLETAFGPWARGIAIQMDLFACTPLLFSLGLYVAARYGNADAAAGGALRELARIPAIWAALLAVGLNLAGVPLPSALDGFMDQLARAVVPLMLFSLGLSLVWGISQRRVMSAVLPLVGIRLIIVPALAALALSFVDLDQPTYAAIVMETAMPSMLLGLVFCDRFNLDVEVYAAAVTISTLLSLVTLPVWFDILS